MVDRTDLLEQHVSYEEEHNLRLLKVKSLAYIGREQINPFWSKPLYRFALLRRDRVHIPQWLEIIKYATAV